MKAVILHNGLEKVSGYESVEDILDTLETVKDISQALNATGFEVASFEVNERNYKSVGEIGCDVVFNLVEDQGWVLSHKVARILEENRLPVVGADFKTLLLTDNKVRVKKLMVANDLPTPAFQVFRTGREKLSPALRFPMIVKPAREHAGLGISQDSVVSGERDLRKRLEYVLNGFKGEATAEEYIEGKEIHVSILGNEKLNVLPPTELVFEGEFNRAWKVYSYEAKWVKQSWEYWSVPNKCPADLSREQQEKITDICCRAYRVFGGRDYMRFDTRIDLQGKMYILDVNANPSLKRDPLDATFSSAVASGMSYEDLIEQVALVAHGRISFQGRDESPVSLFNTV